VILRRWRTFVRPETVDQFEHPTTAEALGLWLLGTAWVLMTLWFAMRGETLLVTPMLAGGLLVVWAWQRDGWLRGVPWVLLAAAVADAAAVVFLPRLRPLGFLDVVVAGAALVAVARRVARRSPRSARLGAAARLMPWPVACAVVGVIVAEPPGPFGMLLHAAALATATLYASRAARVADLLPPVVEGEAA